MLLQTALMPVFLMRYLRSLLAARYAVVGTVAMYAALGAAVAGITLQSIGVVDLSLLIWAYILLDALMIVTVGFCLIQSIRRSTDPELRREAFPSSSCLAACCSTAQTFCLTGTRRGYCSTRWLFLAFSAMETVRLLQTLRETIRRNNEYVRLENELTQSRIAVMLSQIKPHFLFNALNAISALCLTDPVMADQAITSLSQLTCAATSASWSRTRPCLLSRS